jgi:hypothetical protein
MAGGFSSPWTTMGSNTNSTVDTGTSGGGTTGTQLNIDNAQSATGASGTNNMVRHECHMWNVDTNDFSSNPFDWAINTDFTVVVNSAGNTPDADPGAIEVEIEGSVDNSTWKQMQDMGDFSPGTSAVSGVLVYDFDTYGRMPYMRITMNSANGVDNGEKPFKVNVFMHGL